MIEKKHYIKGVIFCLLATLSWGGMFPIMTSALKIIDPFSFTCLRYLIAGIVFLLFLYYKEGRRAFTLDGNKWLLWVFGSAGFAGFGFLVFLGQKIAGPTGALSASIMMATMPLLGLLVVWVLKGIRPPLFSFVFIVLSFFGVILVITKGSPSMIFSAPANYSANLLMVLGALCWVLYTVGGTYYSHWSPIKYTAMSTLFGLPTIIVITGILTLSGFVTFPTASIVIKIIPELIYMALVAGFLGVLCWNIGNRLITPLNGVLFMDVVPVTAFIVSAMFGAIPIPAQIAGVTLTAFALILNNVFQRLRIKTQ